MIWWILGSVFILLFVWGAYVSIKESMHVHFHKNSWLKIKVVDADFDGPEYMRLDRDVTGDSDKYYAFFSAFEPDGKIKESRMWKLSLLGRYELVSPDMAETLEQAYQKRIKEAEEAKIKEKKDMQAKALEAFIKG